MSDARLPDRPNLDNLKKQAKTLLREAHAHDPAALRRFAVLPAFAGKSDAELATTDLALHDAQSVIARELGFDSWNALREEVEARTLTPEAAANEFVLAATGGTRDRAERLLALYPDLPARSFHAALVVGAIDRVNAALERDLSAATRADGPREWEPLLYSCHTCVATTPERQAGLVAIAKRLCALGANPNAEYHWNWHPELPRTALWGAVCVVSHLPLAEALLDAGANPTDGVTTHIASSGGNTAALDLLARYGMNPNGIPGGVPPLVYMMGFATNPAGPLWLLDHGADPNLAWGEEDEAPTHVAAKRWDVAMMDALVRHGGDITRRRRDGRTPRTVAELAGNGAVAKWLADHGAADDLTPIERFVAACTRGDRASADAMLAAHPNLRHELTHDHHLLLETHAEAGHASVLETMCACGFDANVKDKDNVTPLHRASMSGYPEVARVLIAHGADLTAVDGMFAASPLVWAVEGRTHPRKDSDHVGVARVLIAAGSPLTWTPPPGAPSPERAQEGLAALIRDAGVGAPR